MNTQGYKSKRIKKANKAKLTHRRLARLERSMNVPLYFLTWEIDGKTKESNELYSEGVAKIEKRELEADGAKNVKIKSHKAVVKF